VKVPPWIATFLAFENIEFLTTVAEFAQTLSGIGRDEEEPWLRKWHAAACRNTATRPSWSLKYTYIRPTWVPFERFEFRYTEGFLGKV